MRAKKNSKTETKNDESKAPETPKSPTVTIREDNNTSTAVVTKKVRFQLIFLVDPYFFYVGVLLFIFFRVQRR